VGFLGVNNLERGDFSIYKWVRRQGLVFFLNNMGILTNMIRGGDTENEN